MEGNPIVIDQGDLAELKVLQRTQNELFQTLAVATRQKMALDAQCSEINRKIDLFEPQIVGAMKRMERKYGFENKSINLETGAVE